MVSHPGLCNVAQSEGPIMKPHLLLCSVVMFGSAIQANAQTVEFRGSLCLTKTAAACSTDGWQVGDCFLMRYSPPKLGTNGTSTELTLVGQSYADNYSLASGSLIGSKMTPVVALHIGRTGYSFNSTMRIQGQKPNPLLSSSPSVSFTGSLSNFGDSANCTVDFTASGVNRP